MAALTPRTGFELSRGLASTVALHDGTRMPVFGLGVWQTPSGPACREAVGAALATGYRLIDTATLYGNESDVGAAVRASGIPRDQVFVTTKLWNDDQGFDSALKAFRLSQRRLDLGPIDLYLLHWPVPGRRRESWRALRQLKQDGEVRSIGVSNFTVAHLEELLAASDEVPVVNQVEFNPFLYQRDLLEYCEAHRIQLEAYAPLTRGHRLDHPAIQRISGAHRKTAAQVVLRWGLQHGVVVIPKSSRRERIAENAQVFDFELTAEEMRALDALNESYRTTWDPSELP